MRGNEEQSKKRRNKSSEIKMSVCVMDTTEERRGESDSCLLRKQHKHF